MTVPTTMTIALHTGVAVTEQIQTLDIEKEVQPVSITHEQLFALLPLHCLFCHSQNSSFRALHQSSQQQTGTWVQEESSDGLPLNVKFPKERNPFITIQGK